MRNPRLYLALSASLALSQANLLPANADQDKVTVWQQMASSMKTTGAAQAPSAASKKTVKAPRSSVAAQGQAMLFFDGKNKSANQPAPAAALTMHPAMGTDTSLTTGGDAQVAQGQSAGSSKSLLAQLSPDQVIAQADNASVTASPIPPVVTGTVDLEEFKTTNVIDLKVSQSRTFKLKNKIVRTSISDPAVAEPVVVSENQLVLLGKTPGGATLVIWDDAGNSVAIDLRVTRDYGQLQSTLREIDPRIIVKAFSVGGSDRVLLLGDVDNTESVIRAFAASNVYMDDRGFNIQVANSRLIGARIGEMAMQGGSMGSGGQSGQLAQLSSVDKYTFFGNINNNIAKANLISSDGGRVTSLVKVRKVPLIVLHITFMEMNTTAARELGVQLGFNFTSRAFNFGIGGNNTSGTGLSAPGYLSPQNAINFSNVNPGGFSNPVAFTAANTFQSVLPNGATQVVPISGIGLGVLNAAPALLGNTVLLGSPGGASFSTGGLANLFQSTSSWINKSSTASLEPTIEGIISQQRARVLAEPTLVTISGERASFLAGGEIPILQSIATAGAAQQSVTFEPFGLRINMIPVLMENGSLNLEISPEERIVSTQFELNVPGSTSFIPGFTTRKTQTVVEMKPGQELFIAGLITANTGREMDKTPVLGEVPVLGALYRSKAFNKNESELVVAVRPEIILPGTPGQLKLPEEIGRVEGPRDMNMFQVEPTVIDERHYTSGRDERHQKTSPTLPEGSPIPDNE